MSTTKRKPGAQIGNRNALKHGRRSAAAREERRKEAQLLRECRTLLNALARHGKEA